VDNLVQWYTLISRDYEGGISQAVASRFKVGSASQRAVTSGQLAVTSSTSCLHVSTIVVAQANSLL